MMMAYAAAGPEAQGPGREHAAPPAQAKAHCSWQEHYGDDRMVLMIRDPYWCYAYWDLSADKRKRIYAELQQQAVPARLILRVRDVTAADSGTGQVRQYMDILVSPEADNWYIQVWEANHSYCAQLGLLYADNRFAELLASNTITTPRDTVSEMVDEEWMLSEERHIVLFPDPGEELSACSSGQLENYFLRRMRTEAGSESPASMRPTKPWLKADHG